MTTKDEIHLKKREAKKAFFVDIYQKHKELSRRQREYKKMLAMSLKTRSERILERSFMKTIDRLRTERNDLRAQIWVADGLPHVSSDERDLKLIQCQLKCQESLSTEIKELKVRISNMEREIGRGNKQIYELNRKTIPDTQHQSFVAATRKKISILENRVEVGIRRECGFTAFNAALREELKTLLIRRSHFHNLYTKLVQQLNSEKKYLLDLLEYAYNTYDGAIDINEKNLNAKLKFCKEREHAKLEMQSVMRKYAAAELSNGFTSCKSQIRNLAGLHPAEHRRRDTFKRKHLHRIGVYNTVLSKIYDYTHSYNVETVIEKFQQHESLYYSYFSLANELSFHISLLETAVSHLFTNVAQTENKNKLNLVDQRSMFTDLATKLADCKKRNEELNNKLLDTEKQLGNLCYGIATIFNLCRADAAPLTAILGNKSYVDLYNVHSFLKILENRILNIVRSVYVKERDDPNKTVAEYVIADHENIRENPTNLNDIVLTQQCPECAEGEIFNTDDIEDGSVAVLNVADTRNILFEKVNQPEMQYRLHSISQCRLPRSRLLAAKRNM